MKHRKTSFFASPWRCVDPRSLDLTLLRTLASLRRAASRPHAPLRAAPACCCRRALPATRANHCSLSDAFSKGPIYSSTATTRPDHLAQCERPVVGPRGATSVTPIAHSTQQSPRTPAPARRGAINSVASIAALVALVAVARGRSRSHRQSCIYSCGSRIINIFPSVSRAASARTHTPSARRRWRATHADTARAHGHTHTPPAALGAHQWLARAAPLEYACRPAGAAVRSPSRRQPCARCAPSH